MLLLLSLVSAALKKQLLKQLLKHVGTHHKLYILNFNSILRILRIQIK